MIRVAALADDRELRWIRDEIAALTMRRGWEDCEMSGTSRLEEWLGWLGREPAAEIVICDAAVKGAIQGLREFRGRNASALALPIAGAEIPPAEYVRPDVRPVGLLWRPLNGEGNSEMLKSVMEQARSTQEKDDTGFLAVKNRTETRQIPYREIFYFEAREKKVFARLREQETPTGKTIAELEQTVPGYFIRCHKGFMVNRRRIESVGWGEQMIKLEHGLTVPFSRGYRPALKEKLYETE